MSAKITNVCFFGAIVFLLSIAGICISETIVNKIPSLDFQLFLVILSALSIATFVLFKQFKAGLLFSILTLYTGLFILEFISGAIVAGFYTPLPAKSVYPSDVILKSMLVVFAGYLFYLFGYFLKSFKNGFHGISTRVDGGTGEYLENFWSAKFRNLIFFAAFITIMLGFVQFFQRIAHAGGLATFLEVAYSFRFGTYAETEQQNALIVLATLCSRGAIGFLAVLAIAWLYGKLNKSGKIITIGLFALFAVRTLTSASRLPIILPIVSLLALYCYEKKIKTRTILKYGVILAFLIVVLNYLHQYLYYLTAGWDYRTLSQSLFTLVAPLNCFDNLIQIDNASQVTKTLGGAGFLESVFFFVPRFIWETKASSGEYGTMLVQTWAGLPDWYQMAPSDIGELVAHFGYFGIFGMMFYGVVSRIMDDSVSINLEYRVGFYCLLLSRVSVNTAMGISALSVTIIGYLIFIVLIKGIRQLSAGTSRSEN